MAQIGEIIAEKYEILAQINQGGFAKIYLAKDCHLNKTWAIKELTYDQEDPLSYHIYESAMHEANIMKKLEHPDIPRITDIIQQNNTTYVIMDYIEGENMLDVVMNKGALPQDKVIKYFITLAKILDYLHTLNPPLIYRDMKPSNIILKPDGQLKLLDFGITREYKAHQSDDTMISGTTSFAPLEQLASGIQSDQRCDIFALGATIFFLLTAHYYQETLQDEASIRYFNPQLNRGLDQIIKICLKQNPHERFQSAKQLIHALKHIDSYDPFVVLKYRKKQNIFLCLMISSIILFILSLFLFFAAYHINATTYDNYISMVKSSKHLKNAKEISHQEKNKLVDQLFKAMDVDVKKQQAYYELIDLFEADYCFDIEEIVLLKRIEDKLATLNKDQAYAMLCYKIGMLYFYYLDHEISDDLALSILKAKGWIEEAVSIWEANHVDETLAEYQKASIYHAIFQINQHSLNPEGIDATIYQQQLQSLKLLLTFTSDVKAYPPIVIERTMQLALDFISKASVKLYEANVSYEEIQAVVATIKKQLLLVKSDDGVAITKKLKKQLLQMIDGSLKDDLLSVYGEKE